jgi:hypothetical protein
MARNTWNAPGVPLNGAARSLPTHRRGRWLMLASLLAGVVAAGADAAPDKRVWACATEGSSDEHLHLVAWGSRSYVKFDETRFWGGYQTLDSQRRWDFGNASGGESYDYSVILRAGGTADYFDFTSASAGDGVEASHRYHCRLVQS